MTDARDSATPSASAASARFVAADASPLIGLAAAECLGLLPALFGSVVVARVVVDEIMAGASRPGAGAGRPGAAEVSAAMRAGWLRVAPTPMATWRLAGLDPGEAGTLALASEQTGPALVLMDDALGRERAAALGIEAWDVVDILLRAKRDGLVDELGPPLARMESKGFVLPEPRRRAALAP